MQYLSEGRIANRVRDKKVALGTSNSLFHCHARIKRYHIKCEVLFSFKLRIMAVVV